MVKIATLTAVAALLTSPSFAHPGEAHDHEQFKREILARQYWAREAERSVSKCSSSTSARSLDAVNVQRRASTARMLREKRGIKTPAQKLKRAAADLSKWEAIDHNKTGIYSYTAQTSESKVFSGVTSAILAPIVTDGPYYVWGELVRQNVVEKSYSTGIPVHLEVQYYDVETCQPVPGVYVDIWNANATGVYSGISTSGNYAANGYNSTFLRGIQKTDSSGVATFDTIFPGHYSGRATHTHLLAHTNVTVLANNTLLAGKGSVAHIGQLFWNEVLRSAVEATSPYSTNTQAVTSNAADMWSVLQASSAYDPFPDYLYLGSKIEDGIFAWKQIGINTSADYTDNSYYQIAAYLQADGGHAVSGSGGGNGGPPSGSGGPPPGGFPSSTSSSSSSSSAAAATSSKKTTSTTATVKTSSSSSTKKTTTTPTSSTKKSTSTAKSTSKLTAKSSSTTKSMTTTTRKSSSSSSTKSATTTTVHR